MSSIFIAAAKDGNVSVIRELLKSTSAAKVNQQDADDIPNHKSALHWASLNGHVEVARLLMKHRNIAINQTDHGGCTALIYAACSNCVPIVQLLHPRRSLDVNARTKIGNTALMSAAQLGHTEAVQALLLHPHIYVNEQNLDGYTALMLAVEQGHLDTVTLLLKQPYIDTSKKTKSGKTADDLAYTFVIRSMINSYKPLLFPPPPAVAPMQVLSPAWPVGVAPTRNVHTNHAPASPTPPPPPKQVATPAPVETPRSWLVTRLLSSGCSASQANDCHIKLVETEGFLTESDFADCPPSEFDALYLTSVGITAKGLQCHLIKLQAELHAQAQAQRVDCAAAVSPTLSTLSANQMTTNITSSNSSSCDLVIELLTKRVQDLETQMAYLLNSAASLDPVYVSKS